MTDAINELDFLVTWKKVSNGAGGEEDVPYPRPGLDEQFDKASDVEQEAKEKIHKYIEKIRNKLKETHKNDQKMLKLIPQIKYCHSKLRYEIEIPNELVKGDNKPDELVLTSHRVGF